MTIENQNINQYQSIKIRAKVVTLRKIWQNYLFCCFLLLYFKKNDLKMMKNVVVMTFCLALKNKIHLDIQRFSYIGIINPPLCCVKTKVHIRMFLRSLKEADAIVIFLSPQLNKDLAE